MSRSKGEKCPADVIGNAVKIAQIATGEIEDDIQDDSKDKTAQALGKKGGIARASKLSKKKPSEIAKKAQKPAKIIRNNIWNNFLYFCPFL